MGVGKELEVEVFNNFNRVIFLMVILVMRVSFRVVKFLVMKFNKINSSFKLCVIIGKIKVKEVNRVF